MADLSDVTYYLYQQAITAVYPSGTGSPSVANMDCRIYEGWPIGTQLDLDMAGKVESGSPPIPVTRPGGPVANVSVYPMQGTGKTVYQILDKTYVVTPVTFGLSVSITGDVITVAGQPNAGEYLTLVIDRAVICSQTGANTQALLAALAEQAVQSGFAASSTASTLTVPFGHSMAVRQGGVATLGKVTHRQCNQVMITVWAPNRVVRNQIASAIDVALKLTNRITLPDTSEALLIYSRTNVSDEQQASTIYRRDLIYDVEYATLELFPGYVVTSVTTTIDAVGNGNAQSLAIT